MNTESDLPCLQLEYNKREKKKKFFFWEILFDQRKMIFWATIPSLKALVPIVNLLADYEKVHVLMDKF